MNIPTRFRAAVLEEPGRLIVQEIPQWPLHLYEDDDLVLIEVAACGVCGSDFRYFLGENPWAQHTLGRHVPNPPNIVLGHEYAGTVVRVLKSENEYLLGKRVAPICSKSCEYCLDCDEGRPHLCANTVHMGHGQGWGDRPFFPGAYGRYAPAWGTSCYEIPEHLSFVEAAMMDILAVCVHACRVGDVQRGRAVLCIGSGPAGNGIAQAAKAMGASKVVMMDRSPLALKIARRQNLGETIHVSDQTNTELREELDVLAPEGFGTVFDSVGLSETLDLGLRVLGKRGSLVNLAVHDSELLVNPLFLGAERRLLTSCNFELRDYEQALEWLANGKFRVQDWLTKITLDEVPENFSHITGSATKDVFKLVVDLQP